ncbi:MAG: amidohydrolase family protein [Chryseolinea sp.]
MTLHRELVNYVKAGIPVSEVLKIATPQSALVAGKSADFSSITKGKAADIIIIHGAPILEMNDLSKVEIVIKDSKMYNIRDIDHALSIRYFE